MDMIQVHHNFLCQKRKLSGKKVRVRSVFRLDWEKKKGFVD